MAEKHIMDEVGPVEFYSELIKFLGVKRAAELSGYAFMWGSAGLKDTTEVIAWMRKRGVSRATAYRVITEFHVLAMRLETSHGWHGTPVELAHEIKRACIISDMRL